MTSSKPPGGSVFLVEDEVMIRMMVADMLDELGYNVAAEAGDIDEAVRLVQSTDFDIAILDVNVNGNVISPVAEAVSLRGLPFVFATGHGSAGLPEKFRDVPTLQKPFQMATLKRAVDAAGKIHTDLARGVIRAEVTAYDALFDAGSVREAKPKNLPRLDGKRCVGEDSTARDFRSSSTTRPRPSSPF